MNSPCWSSGICQHNFLTDQVDLLYDQHFRLTSNEAERAASQNLLPVANKPNAIRQWGQYQTANEAANLITRKCNRKTGAGSSQPSSTLLRK